MASIEGTQTMTASMADSDQMRLAADAVTFMREGVMITNQLGEILEVNSSFTRITGFGREEALGKNPRILRSGCHDVDFYKQIWADVAEKGYWAGEIWNRRKNGEVFPEMVSIASIKSERNLIKNYVCVFADIGEQKNYQKELERIAHFDVLTGLPNRTLFADRISQALKQSQRDSRLVSVAYIDLDGFKKVNDLYGHSTGDQLLKHVAERMRSALREGDSLARIGGDEFAAVLVDLECQDDCVTVLDRLLRSAADPVALQVESKWVEVQISASIGVALCPSDSSDPDLLLRQADSAMYFAKQNGKNRYHFFAAGKNLEGSSFRA